MPDALAARALCMAQRAGPSTKFSFMLYFILLSDDDADHICPRASVRYPVPVAPAMVMWYGSGSARVDKDDVFN